MLVPSRYVSRTGSEVVATNGKIAITEADDRRRTDNHIPNLSAKKHTFVFVSIRLFDIYIR